MLYFLPFGAAPAGRDAGGATERVPEPALNGKCRCGHTGLTSSPRLRLRAIGLPLHAGVTLLEENSHIFWRYRLAQLC
ncbi:MAG: hypothetical protein MUC60_12805 [Oscillatoria sp. Prado101]|nr:hypothetical protein [Oscillatoria sp. Prado101]